MHEFDIASGALPNAVDGEYWFEEVRDISGVVVRFCGDVPRRIRLDCWRKRWPQVRVEEHSDLEDPAEFGWTATDDWFNGAWQSSRTVRSDTKRAQLGGR